MPATFFSNRDEFEIALDRAFQAGGLKVSSPARKAIVSGLSERDERAAICRDTRGEPEPDPDLRDTESVPLSDSVEAFFDREIKAHVPDAWIDTTKRDPKDGAVGLVKFMRHLAQVVRNGLGDRAGMCIDPKMQIVHGKTVRVVSCQRSPEPVFLKWKGMESVPDGDFFVRSGPGTVKLPPERAREYIRTRFETHTLGTE